VQTLNRTYPESLADHLRSLLATREPIAEAVDGALPAGVLIPLRYHGGQWHVILHLRSNSVGQHKGEVAFPGGRLEPHDPDMIACALRETWEEMGVLPEDVQVIGQLGAVLTRTNFLVWPVVGLVPYPYKFELDDREVTELIELPLDLLLNEQTVRHEARLQPDGTLLKRPSYASESHLIFGATAWILEEFLGLVRDITGTTDTGSLKEAP
jgi:8-oxo-dGTP pyrophosphatase MutT (NUDIX family)